MAVPIIQCPSDSLKSGVFCKNNLPMMGSPAAQP
eukprot:CAMPEP_0171905880 /NCGR_PEP_ID=MMETSP0993-20121228/5525_1 /TAXON_ID=483369 /ORGANISM="non described non described, Strain CCMP2098" /LENGTH=33 /DNA_ID= /DNA_START= /DNA_END= /DNA_ORIENTATION=